MTEFFKGDIVRVHMPRGYTGRGLLSISVMFSTHPEARFEGAVGTVTDINPVGPMTVHQYLIDFRTHDNSKIGIPWQAQWFREEWLELVEQASKTKVAAGGGPESTWPEKPAASDAPATIAHPEARIYKEGREDFAPPGLDPSKPLGSVPPGAYGVAPSHQDQSSDAPDSTAGSVLGDTDAPKETPGIAHPGANLFSEGRRDFAPAGDDTLARPDTAAAPASSDLPSSSNDPLDAGWRTSTPGDKDASNAFTGADRVDDRSAADLPTFEPTPASMTGTVDATTPSSGPGTAGQALSGMTSGIASSQSEGFVRIHGQPDCPEGFPIKGNSNSGIFHAPSDSSYGRTTAEICFASEDVATLHGYRPPARRG